MKNIIGLIMILVILLNISFLFIQAYKIFKTKNCSGVSTLSYFIYLLSSVIWLFYGFYIYDNSLIISSVCGIFGSIVILIGIGLYG